MSSCLDVLDHVLVRRSGVYIKVIHSKRKDFQFFSRAKLYFLSDRQKTEKKLQSATASTTLSAGGVGGDWGAVLDAANLHTGTGQGTEGLLGT